MCVYIHVSCMHTKQYVLNSNIFYPAITNQTHCVWTCMGETGVYYNNSNTFCYNNSVGTCDYLLVEVSLYSVL